MTSPPPPPTLRKKTRSAWEAAYARGKIKRGGGVGHFQYNKIQHDNESYRTQTMKMNNIWARGSPSSRTPRPLCPCHTV